VAIPIEPRLDPGQVEAEPAADLRVRDSILGNETSDVALRDVEQSGQLAKR
jgi:hypothetical protein